MKFRDPMNWGAAFGAGLLASVLLLPQAKGEMVYDDQVQAQAAQPNAAVRAEEREGVRQVLGVSQKAQVSAEAARQPVTSTAIDPNPAAVPVLQTQTVVSTPVAAPVATQQTAATEVQNLSKSELMRRERVREELKNEDILQERLEELRLRDERRRTDQLLGVAPTGPEAGAPLAAPTLKEETIVAPVTERRPGEVAPSGVMAATGPYRDVVVVSASNATSVASEDKSSDKFQLWVQPKGGLTNFNAQGFETKPRYAAGLSVGAAVSDNVSLEVGYSYSESGITMALSNPALAYYDAWRNMYSGYNPNLETHTYKQNTFEAGMKLHLLGPESRVRPFLGGGGAYGKSFVNFEQRFLDAFRGYPGFTSDYEVDQFLGYLTGGLDVRVSKSVSIGATFRYYAVLSSRENHSLDNRPFMYGYNVPAYSNVYGYNDVDKQYLGSSLARTNFYSILAGISFTF